MARKTIRIEIPTGSPDDLIKLAEDIKEHHVSLGSGAELDNSKANSPADRAVIAKAKRKKADELNSQAESLREEAATILGIAPGQTAETKDTVLYEITGLRDELLIKHRGNEQVLGEYGFNITIGTAKTPGPRKKKP
jgi:hypothetical protein